MIPVSFGKKKALLINPKCNNPNLKKKHKLIVNMIERYTSVKVWKKNNNKINYKNLVTLKKNPYLVHPIIEKKNNRTENIKQYFLFLSNINDKKICFFIEKKKPLQISRIYQTRIRFEESLFSGTLFTGYLTISREQKQQQSERNGVIRIFGEIFPNIKKEINSFKKSNDWIFVITDILSYKNTDVSFSLIKRINLIKKIIGRQLYSDSRIDVCSFDIIPYKNYNSIQHFITNEHSYLKYPISKNKINFVSVNDIPCLNTYSISLHYKVSNKNISTEKKISFKNGEWKVTNIIQEKKHSKKNRDMYLKLSDYSDVYWVYEINNWKKYGIARIKTLEESKYIRNLFEKNSNDYIKIKCKWNSEFNKWQPIINLD